LGRTRRLESPFFADATEGRLREGERGSGVKAGLWYGGGDGWKTSLPGVGLRSVADRITRSGDGYFAVADRITRSGDGYFAVADLITRSGDGYFGVRAFLGELSMPTRRRSRTIWLSSWVVTSFWLASRQAAKAWWSSGRV